MNFRDSKQLLVYLDKEGSRMEGTLGLDSVDLRYAFNPNNATQTNLIFVKL